MRTYVLVGLLEDVSGGTEFAASSWPLHLTLLPNFSIAWDSGTLADSVRPLLAGRSPITAAASREALFGPRGTVRVTVVQGGPELLSLHRDLHGVVAAAGGAFEHPAYVAEGYRPHVTVQRHRRLLPGDEVRVDAVSIVDLAPGGAPGRRRILDTLALPNPDGGP